MRAIPIRTPYERLAMAFLVGYPRHSARAYLSDLKAWGAWCAAADVHPFDAHRHHVDAWVRVLTTVPLLRTGKVHEPELDRSPALRRLRVHIYPAFRAKELRLIKPSRAA